MWALINFYAKFCGVFILGKPSWPWRIYSYLADLNLAVFYLEVIYDTIANRKDGAKLLTYICFFLLLNLGMSFKIILNIYQDDVVKCLQWCESRHQINDERILYHSRNIFEEALEFSQRLLKRRMNITSSITIFSFIVGGIIESIQSGEYSTIMGVYSPLYEMDDPIVFFFTTLHQMYAVLYPLMSGLLFGGLSTLIFRYTHGQFALTIELTKEFGAIINVDADNFDINLLKEIVDFYNDAHE